MIKTLSGRNKAFNSSFHSCSIEEWCALTVNKLKEIILSFLSPKDHSIFAIHDTKGIKLLTCLRLNFSHLNEHKFTHYFWNIDFVAILFCIWQEINFSFLFLKNLFFNDINKISLAGLYANITFRKCYENRRNWIDVMPLMISSYLLFWAFSSNWTIYFQNKNLQSKQTDN